MHLFVRRFYTKIFLWNPVSVKIFLKDVRRFSTKHIKGRYLHEINEKSRSGINGYFCIKNPLLWKCPIFITFFYLCALKFKQCFMKVFIIFLDLKFDIFPPWLHENTKIMILHVFKGGKCQSSNQEKIRKYPLFVLFLFTRPIILAKGMIWYNVQLPKIFLKNVCNLGHSTHTYIHLIILTQILLSIFLLLLRT